MWVDVSVTGCLPLSHTQALRELVNMLLAFRRHQTSKPPAVCFFIETRLEAYVFVKPPPGIPGLLFSRAVFSQVGLGFTSVLK